MTSFINTLSFEGKQCRMVFHDGEPWWVAIDVARILGFRSTGSQLSRNLNGAERCIHTTDTPGACPHLACVSESGLYKLVFKSRKPEAKRFTDWVTSEVLPAIRKTGTYSVSTQQPTLPTVHLPLPTGHLPLPTNQSIDVSAISPTQRLLISALVEQMGQVNVCAPHSAPALSGARSILAQPSNSVAFASGGLA